MPDGLSHHITITQHQTADAELIALATSALTPLARLERMDWHATEDGTTNEEIAEAVDAVFGNDDRLLEMPASTLPGLLAKMRVFQRQHRRLVLDGPGMTMSSHDVEHRDRLAQDVMENAVSLLERFTPDTRATTSLSSAMPDAALIAACAAYPAAMANYAANCHADGDPADLAHTAVVDTVDANPPQTWEGLIAKLRAATCNKTTWDELQGWGGWEEQWAGEAGFDLLRLIDAGKLPAMPLPASLDAELIQACAQLPALLDTYNNGADEDDDVNRVPLDQVIDVIQNTRPRTLAGMAAKAKAAQAEAAGGGGIDGSVNDAAAWAWQLVGDLVDLDFAGQVRAHYPELQAGLDQCLIQAEAAYRAIDDGPLNDLCRIDDRGFTAEQDAELDAKKFALIDQQDPHLFTLASAQAATMDGVRAKARAYRRLIGSTKPDPEPVMGSITSDDVLKSLLRDLLDGVGR